MFSSWSQWTAQDWAIFIGVLATALTTAYTVYKGLVAVAMNSAAEQISRLTKRLDVAEGRLDAKDAEIEKLRLENFKVSIQFHKSEIEISRLKVENESQSKQYDKLRSEADELKLQSVKLRRDAANIRDDSNAMRIRISVLEAERAEFLERIEHLEEENKSLKIKLVEAYQERKRTGNGK
jgi:chromosome segregation ATPase